MPCFANRRLMPSKSLRFSPRSSFTICPRVHVGTHATPEEQLCRPCTAAHNRRHDGSVCMYAQGHGGRANIPPQAGRRQSRRAQEHRHTTATDAWPHLHSLGPVRVCHQNSQVGGLHPSEAHQTGSKTPFQTQFHNQRPHATQNTSSSGLLFFPAHLRSHTSRCHRASATRCAS
jgi:hypothetical protein